MRAAGYDKGCNLATLIGREPKTVIGRLTRDKALFLMAQDEPRVGSNGRASSIDGHETVVVPRPNLGASDSGSDDMRAEARRKVALVEGSTPHLSAETRDLLRNRLRMTAILFSWVSLRF
jgi:hypothetical protein